MCTVSVLTGVSLPGFTSARQFTAARSRDACMSYVLICAMGSAELGGRTVTGGVAGMNFRWGQQVFFKRVETLPALLEGHSGIALVLLALPCAESGVDTDDHCWLLGIRSALRIKLIGMLYLETQHWPSFKPVWLMASCHWQPRPVDLVLGTCTRPRNMRVLILPSGFMSLPQSSAGDYAHLCRAATASPCLTRPEPRQDKPSLRAPIVKQRGAAIVKQRGAAAHACPLRSCKH